jgi:hypothetical protein
MSMINNKATSSKDFKLSEIWGILQKIKSGEITEYRNYDHYLISIGLNEGESERLLNLFWEDGAEYLPE